MKVALIHDYIKEYGFHSLAKRFINTQQLGLLQYLLLLTRQVRHETIDAMKPLTGEENSSATPAFQPPQTTVSKTALGVDENVEAALCYVLTWITGIVFLILEKENKFVRFHAMQSVATFLPLQVTMLVPVINLLSIFIIPLYLILWILLMFKAYKGEKFKLPIVGDFAEKQVNR